MNENQFKKLLEKIDSMTRAHEQAIVQVSRLGRSGPCTRWRDEANQLDRKDDRERGEANPIDERKIAVVLRKFNFPDAQAPHFLCVERAEFDGQSCSSLSWVLRSWSP
jgi:hypothetical protein